MSDTKNEQPCCVGCGANKDAEDLYEYPDGARCYDCCGRREREAADAWQQMSLADRIAFGAAHGWVALRWIAEPTRAGWWWWESYSDPLIRSALVLLLARWRDTAKLLRSIADPEPADADLRASSEQLKCCAYQLEAVLRAGKKENAETQRASGEGDAR